MENETIEDIYLSAQCSWGGWDWPQRFNSNPDCDFCGQGIVFDHGDILAVPADACEHYLAAIEKGREYAHQCAADAAEAEAEAAEAIASVRCGDFDAALSHAERACKIESTYGDCPTWRQFRDAIAESEMCCQPDEVITNMTSPSMMGNGDDLARRA